MSRRVVVIGSGLPGLVAARRLTEAGLDVTVLEARHEPAVVAHSPEIDGRLLDTLLLWPRYHRRLFEIISQLGLGLVERPFGDTAFYWEGEARPYFRYQSHTFPGLQKRVVLPGFRGAPDVLRSWAVAAWHARTPTEASVGERFGNTDGFWRYVFPWVCGCLGFPRAEMVLAVPWKAVVEFQRNSLGEPPRMVREGMRGLATKLLEGARWLPGHAVEDVRRVGSSLSVHGSGFTVEADDVLFATPPDRIARIAPDLTEADRRSFEAFHEDTIRLRVHRDPSVMPARRADWHTVSYVVPPDRARGVATTIWWNRVVDLPGPDLFFTWNSPAPLRDVLHTSTLIRVLPSTGNQAFLRERLPTLQGRNRLWFTGVWARPERGGYLEDGAVHAEQTVREMLGR